MVGVPLGVEGRVISPDPCSVSAPGYTGYSRGSSFFLSLKSLLTLDEPQLEGRLKSNAEYFINQPRKGRRRLTDFHPKCELPKSCIDLHQFIHLLVGINLLKVQYVRIFVEKVVTHINRM